jgi:hypothetical protein
VKQECKVNPTDSVPHDDGSQGGLLSPSDAFDCDVRESEPSDVHLRPLSPLRWVILVLCVALIMGPYYSFDNPAGTQVALREYFGVPGEITANSTAEERRDFKNFNAKFELLYS